MSIWSLKKAIYGGNISEIFTHFDEKDRVRVYCMELLAIRIFVKLKDDWRDLHAGQN